MQGCARFARGVHVVRPFQDSNYAEDETRSSETRLPMSLPEWRVIDQIHGVLVQDKISMSDGNDSHDAKTR